MITRDVFRYETIFARTEIDIKIALSTRNYFNLKLQ